MDRIINKYSDLFRLPKEPYMKESQRWPINTKQYRFLPFHNDEIDKQVKDLMMNDESSTQIHPYRLSPKNQIHRAIKDAEW